MNPRRLLLVCAAALGVASAAEAQPSDVRARAEALNDEGRTLVRVLDFDAAAAKFRAAIELQPDPRYYFNLCFTLEKAGALREARAACEVVVGGGAEERLEDKARTRLEAIEAQLGGGRAADPPIEQMEASGPADDEAADTTPPAPIGVPPAPERRLRYGVVGGVAATSFTSGSVGNVESDLGWVVGGALDGAIAGPLTLRTELTVSHRVSDFSGLAGAIRGTTRLTYLDLPLVARASLGSDLRVFVEGGGMFSLRLAATRQTEDAVSGTSEDELDVQKFDAALVIGGGFAIDAGPSELSLVVRYVHGLRAVGTRDGGIASDRKNVSLAVLLSALF